MNSFESHSEVLRLTQDLVSIESHIDAPGHEAAIGRFLVSWFRDHSIDAELLPVEGERANVVARIPGGTGPSLMLNGHIDTVPAGNMTDAFVPIIRENELWGRGACDMKGAIAAMACAMATTACDGMADTLNGDLLFTGTIGEETGSIGVKALVEAGVTATYAIVGEPTSLRVGIAHKGACFIRISLTGRGAHGSCPEEGVNAVSYGSRIIRTLETELRADLAKRTHPLLGASTVSVGRIVGGTQPNIVAEHCQIDIDRRTLPGEKKTLDEISQLVGEICDPIDGLTWRIEEMSETSIVPHVALGTSSDAVLAQAAQATCQQMGLPDEPVGVTYWTDGGHMAACGVESIILGPGTIADAHGPNDRVQTADLIRAVDIYGDLIRRILRPA
jgi:acetylornithine deacetylase/succinyl-diaminopimelate desuccinylase-like protein